MTRQKGRCLHVGREGRDIRAILVDDESGRTMDRTTPMEVVGLHVPNCELFGGKFAYKKSSLVGWT